MNFRLSLLAPLLLSTPLLLAQQASPMASPPPQDRTHGTPGGNRPEARADQMRPDQMRPDQERHVDQREQMEDERMDLDELGLPPGEFWLNPEIVAYATMTPDQVRRLADTYLQGTLKLIQLDANLQMEEARLEPMMAAPALDANAALAQLDRIADARAAIDKADARMAFGLRALLTPDQLMKLRTGSPHPMMQHDNYGRNTRPAPPQG